MVQRSPARANFFKPTHLDEAVRERKRPRFTVAGYTMSSDIRRHRGARRIAAQTRQQRRDFRVFGRELAYDSPAGALGELEKLA